MMLYWYTCHLQFLIEVSSRKSLYQLRTTWTQIQIIFMRGPVQQGSELYLRGRYGIRNERSGVRLERKTNGGTQCHR